MEPIMTLPRTVYLLFGNQLFEPRHLDGRKHDCVVMVEDDAMCRRYAYHQQKLAFILAAMRSHADRLREAGFDVHYYTLAHAVDWRHALDGVRAARDVDTLCHFELENPGLTSAVAGYATDVHDIAGRLRRPPGRAWLAQAAAFLPNSAAAPRHSADADETPVGGRWSFDQDNRAQAAAQTEPIARTARHRPAAARRHRTGARRASPTTRARCSFWVPTTHDQASSWLDDFLTQRFADFGTYEDALTGDRRSSITAPGAAAQHGPADPGSRCSTAR
jgi:deoxyribodipyrimidine photolyase-related protein